MFEQFRTELDEHHDRREKIVKNSRDITASSKKWYACELQNSYLYSFSVSLSFSLCVNPRTPTYLEMIMTSIFALQR